MSVLGFLRFLSLPSPEPSSQALSKPASRRQTMDPDATPFRQPRTNHLRPTPIQKHFPTSLPGSTPASPPHWRSTETRRTPLQESLQQELVASLVEGECDRSSSVSGGFLTSRLPPAASASSSVKIPGFSSLRALLDGLDLRSSANSFGSLPPPIQVRLSWEEFRRGEADAMENR